MQDLVLHYGVFIVALMIFAGELGVPTGIPIEVALLLAGAYTIHSTPMLVLGLALVMVADILGTTTLYLVARTGGSRLLERLLRRHESRGAEVLARWRRRLGGHDALIVFVGRTLPLVRMYITIGTGLLRVRFRSFIVGASPAAVIWAGAPLALGFFFRGSVHDFVARYTLVSHLLLVILPILTGSTAIAWWIKRGRTLWVRIRRSRSVLGFVAALAVAAFLARIVWQHGGIALPLSGMTSWVMALAGVGLGLLAVAIFDLRNAYAWRDHHRPLGQVVTLEVTTTLLWLGLIASASTIMLELGIRMLVL